MADFGKKPKKKTRFGSPPAIEEASTTLEAPETAPLLKKQTKKARGKTGRTIPFGTKVTAKFDDEFRAWAFKNKLKNAELLERMLESDKKLNS